MTPEYRALIDQVLQTSAQKAQDRAQKLGISTGDIPDQETLRQSQLGQQLAQLAEVAEQGLLYIGKLQALAALNDVYITLFGDMITNHPQIPAALQKEPLGQMLNQARARLLDLQDVVNVSEASRQSKLSRTLLYLMIDAGMLHPLEMNGRTMLERRELEQLQQMRREEQPEEKK